MEGARGGYAVPRSASRSSRNSPERGFSLIELTVTIAVIGIFVVGGTILYFTSARSTDVKTAAEMLMEDIRKVHGIVNSCSLTNNQRDRYQIVFHDYDDADPKNAYKVQKRTWSGTAWNNWADVAPQKVTSNVTSGNWIIPGGGDTRLSYNLVDAGGSRDTLVFVSAGSVVKVSPGVDAPATAAMTITVSSASGGKSVTITVSDFGDVTSS